LPTLARGIGSNDSARAQVVASQSTLDADLLVVIAAWPNLLPSTRAKVLQFGGTKERGKAFVPVYGIFLHRCEIFRTGIFTGCATAWSSGDSRLMIRCYSTS
jgi:hypothetical protein